MKRALAGIVLVVGVGLVGLAYGGRLLGLPLHGFVAQLATASASDSALSDALTGLASTPISTLRCASQAPLTAHQRPGAVWEQHRHWLELSRPHTYDHSAYRIGNLRTGVAYQWGYEGPNNTTDAAFGVPTSFAALHPEWAQDPWVLLSDCTEP
jgi:hypothetical protein